MSASVTLLSASQDIMVSPLKENEGQEEMKRTNIDHHKEDEKVLEEASGHNVHIDARKSSTSLDLGPQVSLRLQLENKKDDNKFTQKWNTKDLIGNMHVSKGRDISKDPVVQILSISIKCPGRPEIVLSEPFASSPKACLFALKEGSKYRLRFSFIVSNKDVVGLKYINTLWKAGVRVDKTEVTLGSFEPKEEPYAYELNEDTTPSGIFVRGMYCAKIKVVDKHGKCYLDIKYYFEIQKNWPSSS